MKIRMAVKAYTFSNTDKTEGEWEGVKEFVSISGGTFSSDVTDYLDDGCELDETGSVVPSNDSVASIEGKGYACFGCRHHRRPEWRYYYDFEGGSG